MADVVLNHVGYGDRGHGFNPFYMPEYFHNCTMLAEANAGAHSTVAPTSSPDLERRRALCARAAPLHPALPNHFCMAARCDVCGMHVAACGMHVAALHVVAQASTAENTPKLAMPHLTCLHPANP